MKKLIIWLAKVFNVIITKEVIAEKEVEKIVYKDRIVEVQVALDNEVIKGTCTALVEYPLINREQECRD